ncbi:TPA: hypothetical protein TY903_000028 [Streptococcus suis]|nr:hypothetical protein [Streptococcus suis]
MIIVYSIANRELSQVTAAAVQNAVNAAGLQNKLLFNRQQTEVLADIVYDLHKAHAYKNGGRLLFTTQKGTTRVPTEIILLHESRQKALHGTLIPFGKYSSAHPDGTYTVPPLWYLENLYVEQPAGYAWYKIDNVKEIYHDQLKNYTTKIGNKSVPITNSASRSPFYAE